MVTDHSRETLTLSTLIQKHNTDAIITSWDTLGKYPSEFTTPFPLERKIFQKFKLCAVPRRSMASAE